jgi:HEAT repeat protein
MMSHVKLTNAARLLGLVAIVNLIAVIPARAYIDLAPTLSKVISDSRGIAVVDVVSFDRARHEIVMKEIRALKGELSSDTVTHDVLPTESATIPRSILQWAAPGARGVLFTSRTTALVCFGNGWYQARSATGRGAWKIGTDRPDLPLAYYGSVSRLTESIELMLAGKNAVLTVVAHGADNEAASFDLALNRQSLPGLVRLQRIRADMNMPQTVMAASGNANYSLGSGVVDESDLPALIAKLKSDDATTRAEAADDIRSLGKVARSTATAPLTSLLQDGDARVRFAAASALLKINPKQTSALEVLSKGLESSDAAVRREAARNTGLGGATAGALSEKLGALLQMDADESVRVASLQAIATLGPAASKAAPAVIPLLDNQDFMIDAADALGRIGAPAASPALPKLAKMLSSDQAEIRWAAVRGMSQIGGKEAHPAVEFMIQALRNATEAEGYNMMIYLSLLGPIASDALPAVRNAPIKNPVLPSSTAWAISPEQYLPWQYGGGRGGRGGGGGGPGDIALLIYEDYVRELGPRLAPMAKTLAQNIMDGTEGNMPSWGYELLACGGAEAATVLTPHLSSDDLNVRERATVALGYMGPAAISARGALSTALAKAPTEREKRLIEWSLRKLEAE